MKNNLELLLYSFDGELSREEQQRLETALAASPKLQAERNKLLKMRELIGGLKISEDSSFSEKVMQRLKDSSNCEAKTTFSATVVSLFPRVAAACILILLLAISIVYLTEGYYATDALIGTDAFSLEDAYSLIEY